MVTFEQESMDSEEKVHTFVLLNLQLAIVCRKAVYLLGSALIPVINLNTPFICEAAGR